MLTCICTPCYSAKLESLDRLRDGAPCPISTAMTLNYPIYFCYFFGVIPCNTHYFGTFTHSYEGQGAFFLKDTLSEIAMYIFVKIFACLRACRHTYAYAFSGHVCSHAPVYIYAYVYAKRYYVYVCMFVCICAFQLLYKSHATAYICTVYYTFSSK